MKRREFLLNCAVLTASGIASSLFPKKSKADPSNDQKGISKNHKQESEFYKIDAFSHFAPASFLDYFKVTWWPTS